MLTAVHAGTPRRVTPFPPAKYKQSLSLPGCAILHLHICVCYCLFMLDQSTIDTTANRRDGSLACHLSSLITQNRD
jgi:hypothetical protein